MVKLCPIPTNSEYGHSYKDECEEEKCAWWDSMEDQCSITTMAAALRVISREKEQSMI